MSMPITIKYEIYSIISNTLRRIRLYSDDAAMLVYRTGIVETDYEHLEQDYGSALGLFQIEKTTANDIIDNWLRFRPRREQDLLSLGFLRNDVEFSIKTNIAVQIAFCRFVYRRVKEPIPQSLEGQANYWKKYYNTVAGKGDVDKFIRLNSLGE